MKCCTTAQKLTPPSFSGPCFPVLTRVIPALLQEPGIFPTDLTANHGVPPIQQKPGAPQPPFPAETLSLHCQESNGDWENPEPQLQTIPISSQGFGRPKSNSCLCIFLDHIFLLCGLLRWEVLLGMEKVTPAFWGCIGKGGALGLLLSQRSHPANP